MTRQISFGPGQVRGLKDGVPFFDTDFYPVGYVPEADEVYLTSEVITFPDFLKGNAYCWMQWDSGTGGAVQESAISLITMPNQEWGPATANPTSGCQIDDAVIGTIPATADTFLVEVKGSRTNSPSNVNGNAVPTLLQEGEWNPAYGGSLPLELMYPFVRMLQFYKAAADNGDGTRNVLMRMKQSVVKQRQSFYRSGNDSSKTGWTYGGTNGSAFGIPVSQRATAGPTTDPTGVGGRHRRTGASPAATSDNTDYSSEYTLDIRITPGRSSIVPSTEGTGTGAKFAFVDEQSGDNTGISHTRTMQFGDALPDRTVIVAVAAQSGVNTRDISSVTIEGASGSVQTLAYERDTNANSFMAGIYAVQVPEAQGTSGDVTVTFSGGTMVASAFMVFVAYGLNSLTPDDTIESTADNSNQSLSTVANGFAIAVSSINHNYGNMVFFNVPEERFYLTGIENNAIAPLQNSTENTRSFIRGFQLTDGSTLSIMQKYLSAASGNPPIDPGGLAWVAASLH
jgi:hypothetical protein